MAQTARKISAPAPLVALSGWIIPGSGYFLIGDGMRGLVIGVTVLAVFIFGILLAGIRVIDVPGYDDRGQAVYVELQAADGLMREVKNTQAAGRWSLVAHPLEEISNKPWFMGQVLAGPICLASAYWSLAVSDPQGRWGGIPRSHARIAEIGTLYTAVAGMLNLLAVIDAAYRAGQGTGKS